jgi:hypothetical protein
MEEAGETKKTDKKSNHHKAPLNRGWIFASGSEVRKISVLGHFLRVSQRAGFALAGF